MIAMPLTSALETLVKSLIRLSGARRDRLAYVTLVIVLHALLVAGLLIPALWLIQRDHETSAVIGLLAGSLALTSLAHVLLRRTLFEKLLSLKAGLHEAERSRDEAKQTIEEKTRMLATMSHEIRTPLNGVIGTLGLLLETELTAEQQNYARMSHASGRTLLSFIDEILDGARAASSLVGQGGPVDLLALVENVTELLAPRAHAKGIDIACRVDPALPATLDLPDMKLRQLIFNLAGNAIKFTAKGGVSIEASRHQSGSLQLCVRDTGIGMTGEETTRLFRPFAQANDQTRQRYGGTGLGLYICKQIVDALGGTLDVNSVRGEGTTFTVRIPSAETVVANPLRTLPLAGRRFVLAMSDDFATRHLTRSLTDLGADCVAPSGSTDDLLEQDLAIIGDPKTAKMLLAAARKRRVREKTLPPIWVLLAPEERRPMKHLLRKPVTGYLLRPVRRNTLVKQLSEGDPAALRSTSLRMRNTSGARPQGQELRVLLTDDTPVNAFIAKTILQRAGHEVTVASNGMETLEILESGKTFDILLLDVEMPGLNGPETAEKIRERERINLSLPFLPILALTASTHPEVIATCRRSGMDGHLAKPFDEEDLWQAMASLVHGQAA